MFSTDSEVTFSRYGEAHPASELTPQEMRRLLAAYDHLLDRHMPAAILVDDLWNVVDTYGDAAQYMRRRSRRPTNSLIEQANEPLKEFLVESRRRLINGEQTIHHTLHLGSNSDGNHAALTQVRISQVPLGIEDRTYYLIRFESIGSHHTGRAVTDGSYIAGLQNKPFSVQQIVREPIADEFEVASPVSVHTGPVQPLHQFAVKTHLAVIFIDLDLRIRYFTPRAAEKFNLEPHDVGRRLQTFSVALNYRI